MAKHPFFRKPRQDLWGCPIPFHIGYRVNRGKHDVFVSERYHVQPNKELTIYLPDHIIRPHSICLQFHDRDIIWALRHKFRRGITRPFRPDVYDVKIHNVYQPLQKKVKLHENGCLEVLRSQMEEVTLPHPTPRYYVTAKKGVFRNHLSSFNHNVVPYISLRVAIDEVLRDIYDKNQQSISKMGLPTELNELVTTYVPEFKRKNCFWVSAIVLFEKESAHSDREKMMDEHSYSWDLGRQDGWFS
jgi:hypothetical protein